MTVDELLAEGRRCLAGASLPVPAREAGLLLRHVLGLSEAQLLTRSAEPVSPEEAARYRDLLVRRLAGEPVAYLAGEKEFYGRAFRVDRRVLIPRPETEHLVEAALALPLPPAPRILDVGTGSGCLAVTLALEIPGARVLGTDISPAALAVAAGNARRLAAAERLRLVATDLARGLDVAAFDLVVSNPPYVGSEDATSLPRDVREHEPRAALFAGRRGFAVLDRLLDELAPLRPGTPVLLEIGLGQDAELARRAARSPLALREVRPDYAAIPRIALLFRR